MYQLFYDGQLLHDPRTDDRVCTACSLEATVNAAAKLKFTIQPTHPLYGTFVPLDPMHEVTVENDGTEVFRGRILADVADITTATTITCESELAYLDDSLVRPYGTYPDTSDDPQWTTIAPNTQHSYVEWLVGQHNASSDGSKQFAIDSIEVDESPITRSSTVWSSTASELIDKVLDPLGLVVDVRHRGEGRYLTFRKSANLMPQPVELGTNILDFKPEDDYEQVVTCIVPYNNDTEGPDISTYPDGPVGDCYKQGDRIWSQEGVAAHGIIEERRSYDASTVDGMVRQVVSDLDNKRQPIRSLDVSVVDLHDVDPSIPPIRLGDMLRVTSRPHGIDQWMMASKCNLDICDPASSTWTFGALKQSLTKSNVVQVMSVEQSMTSVVQSTSAISAEAQQAAQDAAQASDDAAAAITAAAEKRRVFTSTPTPPYDVGDIWIVGDGEIKECIVAKES